VTLGKDSTIFLSRPFCCPVSLGCLLMVRALLLSLDPPGRDAPAGKMPALQERRCSTTDFLMPKECAPQSLRAWYPRR
jgi:hypothetical protein